MAKTATPDGKAITEPVGGTLTDDKTPDTKVDDKKVDDKKPAGESKTAEQLAAEKKTADDAAAAAAAKKKTDDDAAAAAAAQKEKAGKAPDKYELALPDGADAYLDESDLKSIESIARAKGWTNEDAQAALDEHAENLATQSKAFRAEIEKDETYGGEHLAETQRLAKLALDKVRPGESGKPLRRLLAKSGYGNNLAIVSFLADLGKLFDEDRPGGTGGSQNAASDAATALYGKTSG